jgi:hypothetical protein
MSDKLRIAVCYSGEPRYAERCIRGLQNLLQIPDIEIDVFYHLWDNITKRQQRLREEPVLENIDKNYIQDKLKPTAGVIESKDSIEPSAEKLYTRAHELIEINKIKVKNNKLSTGKLSLVEMLQDKDIFFNQIKYTNYPWYSQLYSLGKAQEIRKKYQQKHNITYDFIIRSRTDVELLCKDGCNKLKESINHWNKDKHGPHNTIYFPSMYIKNSKRNIQQINNGEPFELPIHVEYCHFIGQQKIIDELFDGYQQEIMEYVIQPKNNTGLFQPTSHTLFPWLILKKLECRLSVGTPSIRHKLLQMSNLEHNFYPDGHIRKKPKEK